MPAKGCTVDISPFVTIIVMRPRTYLQGHVGAPGGNSSVTSPRQTDKRKVERGGGGLKTGACGGAARWGDSLYDAFGQKKLKQRQSTGILNDESGLQITSASFFFHPLLRISQNIELVLLSGADLDCYLFLCLAATL